MFLHIFNAIFWMSTIKSQEKYEIFPNHLPALFYDRVVKVAGAIWQFVLKDHSFASLSVVP